MIPQRVPLVDRSGQMGQADSGQGPVLCLFSEKWLIDLELAYRLGRMAYELAYGGEVAIVLSIISGYRTYERQQEVGKLDPSRSTHTSCPATGADISVNVAVTDVVKALVGAAGFRAGLRWGGGAPVDSRGIPIDNEWAHFDLGRRQ